MNKNEKPIRSLISGMSSGGVTAFLFNPLDVLKVRLQAMGRGNHATTKHIGLREVFHTTKNIFKNEGAASFLSGAKAGCLGSSLAWGFYFLIYNSTKNYFHQKKKFKGDLSLTELLISSTFSGLFTSTTIHPIWLIKTRMQLNAEAVHKLKKKGVNPFNDKSIYRSTSHCFQRTIQNEGFQGLFKGLGASLAMTMHGIIFFISYDKLKYFYMKKTKREAHDISSTASFLMSGFAKIFATLFSHPFSVAKTRVQDQKNFTHDVKYKGITDALLKMKAKEGFLAFYRGLVPQLVRSVPLGAVTLVFYEYFINFMVKEDHL